MGKKSEYTVTTVGEPNLDALGETLAKILTEKFGVLITHTYIENYYVDKERGGDVDGTIESEL
ncbi:hypothetical protein KWL13_007260 [Clostridioides difficile]|uniref:hypothetical protein n=1 Tax=Clostridioides difficile TaxID=1496 RepID=UPI000BB19D48|nr:hypothetical protein [Clostridioides difficile]EGT5271426.1 hypothetical protein [Clostridioides difficile]EGT5470842.1 hypothetical protein [Clostridioides difficile]MBH8089363.1 hypothetical protein [Clostridioides difficile]MBY1609979.1 hypothetical protein [Clostridioides difficile]MBY2092612.1 hypothetical protein [Clostridioides difficile]